MKRSAIVAILVSLPLLCVGFAAQPGTPPSQEEQQLARIIRDLQEQQATIAQNQAKIDEKLAAVAEAIRQARIFASRGGAK